MSSHDPAARYRPVRTSLWPTFSCLSPEARLTMVALLTGSTSNMAGIGYMLREPLMRETGLDAGEIESALAELEKKPTAARSFIVRDDLVIWCRDALRDAPKVLDERQRFASDLHRKGVKALLGTLPATSPTVQKFKRAYKLALQAPSEPLRSPSETPPKVRRTDSDSENRTQIRRTDTEGESEGKPNTAGDASPATPSGSLSLVSSNHGNGHGHSESASAPALRETATADRRAQAHAGWTAYRYPTSDEMDLESTRISRQHPELSKDDIYVEALKSLNHLIGRQR